MLSTSRSVVRLVKLTLRCSRRFSAQNGQKLKNRVVILTGASGGIGRATAKLFQANGAKVFAIDIDGKALTALTDECNNGRSAVANITGIVGDVSDEESVADYLQKIYGETKQIDSLINIAGYQGKFSLVHESDTLDQKKMFDVNYWGSYYNIKHAVPLMMATQQQQKDDDTNKTKYKTIVNTSSIAGKLGAAFGCAYAASKHAVMGLTKVVAAEYGSMNIRCNAVMPGAITTQMLRDTEDFVSGMGANVDELWMGRIGLQRRGSPDEVAQLILFLACDDSSYCHGQGYVVDGQIVDKF